ncbi:MAG TPA: DUF5679 domain-containing protein [Candidatus Pacearchaeota archaeon]|nr:DUF5679 domain-containing protein [Candidatus Pacearchaeota archaeon]HOR52184.1 DUF5679 domain-containing protein [Candidatus Pacearchaeota archaeon]HOU79483.1 DUF5679 domain-containing protein [Candidatus Pacearchaeota archaeon]HPJ86686.1 DUF5679 domain-containing protein [Candidatus Pacearchaeota archaeon]HQF83134.1 DUF5679 domain-containing protein [Candidatus Pacearchaeota archaeon]
MVEAYCVKCKKKGQKMKEAVMTRTAKGGFMAKGKCPDCGTIMCAMMSAEKAEKAIKDGKAKKGY